MRLGSCEDSSFWAVVICPCKGSITIQVFMVLQYSQSTSSYLQGDHALPGLPNRLEPARCAALGKMQDTGRGPAQHQLQEWVWWALINTTHQHNITYKSECNITVSIIQAQDTTRWLSCTTAKLTHSTYSKEIQQEVLGFRDILTCYVQAFLILSASRMVKQPDRAQNAVILREDARTERFGKLAFRCRT